MSKPDADALKAFLKGKTPLTDLPGWPAFKEGLDKEWDRAMKQEEEWDKPKYTPEQVEKMLDQQTGITDDTSWIVSDSAKDHPGTPTHFQLPETKTPEPKKVKHKLVELQDREFEI